QNYVTECKFHQVIQLDKNKQFRVNSSCEELSETITQSWFVLPPIMEYYYKKSHPTYKNLPSFRNDCLSTNTSPMEFIYPKNGSNIVLAKNFTGELNEV
ncbi:penicillin-binding protein 1C, partial [Aquimarina celericrescens]|nr:penicillin-binding protein 1C [Aquimarina celericrescens]